jgi:energy-coupling factor transporter transmembrane protein EcfT
MVVAQLPPKVTYKQAMSLEPWLTLLVLVLGGTLEGLLASELLSALAAGIFPAIVGGVIILVALIIFGGALAKLWLLKPSQPPNPPWLLLLLLGILCISFSGPALLLYWVLRPEYHKKAIQTSVFLLGLGAALLYLRARPEKLPTMADKVTFLTGVCLGPPTALEFMI